jgi:hypothetical protein
MSMTTEQIGKVIDQAIEHLGDCTTEIIRLRVALAGIAAITPKPIAYAKYKDQAVAYWAAFNRCREIARAALEPMP